MPSSGRLTAFLCGITTLLFCRASIPGVAVDERTAGRAGRPARRGYQRLIRSPWHLSWLAVILATACTGVTRDHAAAPSRTPQPRTATEQTEVAATWAAYQLPAGLTGATAI